MEAPRLTHEVYSNEVPAAVFVREVLSRALSYIESFRWPTDHKSLNFSDLNTLVRQKTSSGEEAVFSLEGCCARVDISGGFVKGEVSGEPHRVAAAIEAFRRLLPPVELDEEPIVPVTFWRGTNRGAFSSQRKIAASSWDAVKENYPARTRTQLDELIEGFRPSGTGHLILWHGEPGTGKTHALRALAWEWRDWCRIEYVVDPERFLGESDYLMRVLMDDPHEDLLGEDDHENRSQWRLLALEDAGELVAPGARDQVGQKLSRLLNTVDGLLGEGLRLLVLITTNEELSGLHPAVARVGRCAAEIDFARFTVPEAIKWGRAKGVANIANSSMSLAELFDAVDGGSIRSRTRTLDSTSYL